MAARLGFVDLVRAGLRAVSRYTGTLLSVFVVQSLFAAACMLAIALVLAQAFAHLPMFDDAVDGDLVSIIWCVRQAKASFLAIGGILLGVLLFWQLASWFLIGGFNGVLAQRPEGRGDTARCFGASGAATYLTYIRLTLCSLPGYALVLFLFGIGMSLIGDRVDHALTVMQLLTPIVLAALPAIVLLHVLWTVADYARIELTLRHDSHDPGVVATYLRTFAYVLKRPITLLHAGFGWVLFLVVSIAYAYLAQGQPMYGAEGAVTLFFVRQGVALLRMAIKVGIMGGQLELGRTRALPPRRVEVKVDAKT
ncbi:MAG: hypothetical protein H0T89_13670 [Deltaproteobacteria bacterium]|nr:hypothetical protein [Deltaproteobacteria bacterium]MDQ3300416.1 hypothetical protein [Myxococcota bacterium]